MKKRWYPSVSARLAAVFLCASFLTAYGGTAAAENSMGSAEHQQEESAAVDLPGALNTDVGAVYGEIYLNALDEAEEQSAQDLYASRAGKWYLTLVNADHPLSRDYKAQLVDIGDGLQFDRRAADNLLQMISDGRNAGYDLLVCSAYRSRETQSTLYQQQIQKQLAAGKSEKQAQKAAARFVAAPGTSEHETGMAADIITQQYSEQYSSLTRGFENTDAFRWLKKHCAEYGFILRYPEGKTSETGVIYEPWHFRFVGKVSAEAIRDGDLTLEEYVGAIQ